MSWEAPSRHNQVNQIFNRNSIAFSTWAIRHRNRLRNSNRNSWQFQASTQAALVKHGCKCRIRKLKINSPYHVLLRSRKTWASLKHIRSFFSKELAFKKLKWSIMKSSQLAKAYKMHRCACSCIAGSLPSSLSLQWEAPLRTPLWWSWVISARAWYEHEDGDVCNWVN